MLNIRHVCTDCGHKPICSIQDDFMSQLEKVTQNKGEDYFIIEITCKHYSSARIDRPSDLGRRERFEKQFNLK